MANVLTKNIYSCASLGIISEGPITLRGINFYPDAVDDSFQLKWWDEDSKSLYSGLCTYTITVSTDNTVTATTNVFPNTWVDGNVVKCLHTTGTDSNKYGLIQTAGNNTAFVTWGAPFTTEAAKIGAWECYPTYNAFRGKMTKAADTEYSMWFPFPGNGFTFPNLALDSLSTSAVVDLYVE